MQYLQSILRRAQYAITHAFLLMIAISWVGPVCGYWKLGIVLHCAVIAFALSGYWRMFDPPLAVFTTLAMTGVGIQAFWQFQRVLPPLLATALLMPLCIVWLAQVLYLGSHLVSFAVNVHEHHRQRRSLNVLWPKASDGWKCQRGITHVVLGFIHVDEESREPKNVCNAMLGMAEGVWTKTTEQGDVITWVCTVENLSAVAIEQIELLQRYWGSDCSIATVHQFDDEIQEQGSQDPAEQAPKTDASPCSSCGE